MKKISNVLVYSLALLICVGLVASSTSAMSIGEGVNINIENFYEAQGESNLGGQIHNVLESFDAGIAVNGTVIIDSDGNWDGAITGTTGTLSSTLAVTGASTFTGEVTMKEATTAITGTTASTTVAQSGTSFYVTLASTTAGSLIELPTLTDGAFYDYIMATSSATTTNIIIKSTEGDNIEGSLIVDGTAVPCVGEDQINIVASAEAKGDFVKLKSDGTQWYVYGVGEAAGSITCTDPS